MSAVIKSIRQGSPCENSIVKPGDILKKINGQKITDVLDYMYFSNDEYLLLELRTGKNEYKLIEIDNPYGVNIGLEFENSLMDEERSCTNKCIFCFIDQLPKGMRETLYYKDDDVRLSFLQGNYITLTNSSESDIERIIKLRISPVNVSIHTLSPKLRLYMMGNEKAATVNGVLKRFANAGIMLNCQIVCCPDVNDGAELIKTITKLIALGDSVNSVSVVPVGLTKHRHDLTEIRPFDRELARKVIATVSHYGKLCLIKRESRVFFCADELYMMAGMELPEHDFYEDYPQLENGVGMMRLFITEFEDEMNKHNFDEVFSSAHDDNSFSIVTGKLAQKYLKNLLETASGKYATIKGGVYAVENDFFGDKITVSGLITGRDIVNQLKDKNLGSRLFIPQNMLRHDDDVFLDDMTTSQLSEELGVEVCVIKQDGAELFKAMMNRN